MAKGFINLNPFKHGKAIKQSSKRRVARQSSPKRGAIAKVDKFNFSPIVSDDTHITKLNEPTEQKRKVAALIHITC